MDTTKTPAGRRILYLDEVLVGLLKTHKRRQAEERLRAGRWSSEWNEHPWVFTGPEGHPIDHSVDRRDWKKVVDQAGISKTRIHDLRHTNATMLLMNNVDTRTVMSMLGWSRTAIAARYQHPVAEMQKNAATKVADFMLGRDTGAK
ncbi:tyrosine-type recombinase/integrase [Enemella evansiae]|uniref:tyrosine-type recombinase/integrase n=1 Tax=Enemella evansiae TaxID=2016499 RepID=UPI0015C5F8BB|nr:tyrosine-type recombinase/integrase [Enemella evansiae]